MCNILRIKTSSYYDWLNRSPSKQQQYRRYCELLVRSAHTDMKEKYGSERLSAYLAQNGHHISHYMVRSLKQQHGIYCARHKRYKVTTNSNHNKKIYPNLLRKQFDTISPNQEWVSDITYIWTNEGWLYLAGVKDLYTKEVVGYSLGSRMTADLVCKALSMAIHHKRPAKGLIIHSDRGGQYCSHAYRDLIKKHHLSGSMSRKGNCYDNAPIESFWAILKNELIYHENYETRIKAITDITRYIELEYNQTRIQKGLGMLTPRQAWSKYYRQAA